MPSVEEMIMEAVFALWSSSSPGVESLVVRGDGVEDSSDGTGNVEADDEMPSGVFCMEGSRRV